METLNKLNHILERCMPIITPGSMIIGILFADHLGGLLYLPVYFFAFMTFSGSLNCSFSDLRNVLRHPKPLFIIFFLLHIWMPLLAFGAGNLLFPSEPNLITGILIAFIIPTGVISMIWVSIYRGNIALTLSVILLDTLISPFLMPLTLKLLLGADLQIGVWDMMKDLLLMIALPAVLAIAIHDCSHGRLSSFLSPRLAPASKLAIIPVIAINSTKLTPFFHDLKPVYLAVAGLIFFLAVSAYAWGWLAAKIMKQSEETTISIFFNGSMRNISAGAVIAVQFFPSEAVFPVMIGTLFQQILAAGAGLFLAKRRELAKKRRLVDDPVAE